MRSITDGCSSRYFPASCHARAQRLKRIETPKGGQASWRACIVFLSVENQKVCPVVACFYFSVAAGANRRSSVAGPIPLWLLVPARHLGLVGIWAQSCRVRALTSCGSLQILANGNSHRRMDDLRN